MSVIGYSPLVGRRVDAEFGFDAVQSGFEVVVALADIFVLAAQPFGFHARGESHDHLATAV